MSKIGLTNNKKQLKSSNDIDNNKDVELNDGSEDEKPKKVTKKNVKKEPAVVKEKIEKYESDNDICVTKDFFNTKCNDENEIHVKKTCSCIFDSQIAYIADSLKCNDENNEKFVTIGDYLNNKEIQKEVSDKKIYLVCKENEELIKYESDKKKNHFKHKNCEHGNMSEWHKKWQSEFDETEIQIGNRYADVLCGNYVLEFQHSPISKELVDTRLKNYKDNGKSLLWIIDCNGKLDVDNFDKNYVIRFRYNKWIYESFTGCEYVLLNIGEKIFRINPNFVKGYCVLVGEHKDRKTFIEEIKLDKIVWGELFEYTGKIYQNQRGAGCGKTYESVRIVTKNIFRDKNYFIYLTKLSSAVNAIKTEILDLRKEIDGGTQFELKITDFKEIPVIDKKTKKIDIKKHHFECLRNGAKATILIGTVDSFTMSLHSGKINNNSLDIFQDVVTSLGNGNINKNASFRQHKLSVKTIILVDESQDLDKSYFDAFWKILNFTNSDVYLIGDRLQSILSSENVFTYLEKNRCLFNNILYDKNSSINKVERFHNPIFKDFVNNVVNFDWYCGLPKITNICTRTETCGHIHKNNYDAVKIFQIPVIYSNDHEEDKIANCVDMIIKYMEKEIIENSYLPHDFMIIFPILSKNLLASRICERIQEFWDEKVNDKVYLKILKTDEYWNNNAKKGKKFVFLHKSEEGQPINLEESKNATQILTIHSAKGNGRKCVFVLGLNDYALKLFSTSISKQSSPNIVYDSLVHVAMTRHKEKLYVGLQNDNGDIWTKFNNLKNIKKEWKIKMDGTIKPVNPDNFDLRYDKIIEYYVKNSDSYEKLCNEIIIPEKMLGKFLFDENFRGLIGMEHHIIRQKSLEYNFLFNMYIDGSRGDEQFTKQMRNISKKEPRKFIHNEYFKYLDTISKNSKSKQYNDTNFIPVLEYARVDKSSYGKYADILEKYIKNIQLKIKNEKLAELCPIECVVYSFMCEIIDNHYYADISITDVYSTFYYYDEYVSLKGIDEKHTKEYKCECTKCFSKKSNSEMLSNQAYIVGETVVNHYTSLNKVSTLYKKFLKKIQNYLNEPVKCFKTKKTFHLLRSSDFNISRKFNLIGLSDNYIVHVILRHSVNLLNINNILTNVVFDNYLLSCFKEEDSNLEYKNKLVLACVISLDLDEPIFVEFDISKYFDFLTKTILNFLCEKYYLINDQVVKRYEWILNNSKHKNMELDFKEFWLNFLSCGEYKIPDYICSYVEKVYNGYLFDKDEDNIFSEDSENITDDLAKDLEKIKPKNILENINTIAKKKIKDLLIQKRKNTLNYLKNNRDKIIGRRNEKIINCVHDEEMTDDSFDDESYCVEKNIFKKSESDEKPKKISKKKIVLKDDKPKRVTKNSKEK